jgi:hypothetical protein
VNDIACARERINPHVEKIKNALLSYALFKVCKDDIDEINKDYKSFDGTKLPMLSGFSTENACYSYVVPKEEYENNVFHSDVMASKMEAIDKYFAKNFGSDGKAMNFFVKFLDIINHYPSTKDYTNEEIQTEMSDARGVAPKNNDTPSENDLPNVETTDNEYNIVEKKDV